MSDPVQPNDQPTVVAPSENTFYQTAKPATQPAIKPTKRRWLKIITIVVVASVVLGVTGYAGWRLGYNAGAHHESEQYFGCQPHCNVMMKPVIYLYPQTATEATVRVTYPAGFTETIPRYNDSTGWQVLAEPDGTIINLEDNRKYPYLFWEGNDPGIIYDMRKGFVIAGQQTNEFLQTKLAEIGLNQTEANDFIEFWEPKLAKNPYNLIHFSGAQYTDYAKLDITPQPDSTLRVMMVARALDTPIGVEPQAFPTFTRTGFTAVEWGGTQIK